MMKKWFLILGVVLGGWFVATTDFPGKSREASKQAPQKERPGKELLETAAKGDQAAQHLLAQVYIENYNFRKRHGHSDEDIRKEIDQATMWLEKSAAQGFSPAKFDLGMHYQTGFGVPLDRGKGITMVREAADQGYAHAQSKMGWAYEEAQGVPRDFQQAMDWYLKAAAQDDVYAQYKLGRMYAEGRGVLANVEEAKEWFKKAAHGGYEAAEKELRKIERGQHR